MSTTVTYKGSTLATVNNNTKTLKTAGKYMEGDVVLTDVSGGTSAISVVDTIDSHGGTIREITALDISDTTAVASDVAQGKYFYTSAGVKTAGTATGGGTGGNVWQDENGYVHLDDEGSSTTRIVVPEQTATPTAASQYQEIDFDEPFVLGEEYIVTINGVTRYITAADIYGSIGVVWIANKLMVEYVANNNKMYLSGISADVQDIAYTVKVEKVTGGGGGGLEYETGTLTLSSDESTPIISFTNTHTDVPIYINITDVTETLATDSSNLYWTFMNWYTLNDSFIKTTSSSNIYGRYQYGWKTSSGASAGNIDCTNIGTGSSSLYYLVESTRFGPYCGSNNRYWRAGRTYKWIAVWAPTA